MKKIIIILVLILIIPFTSFAAIRVSGYIKKNGTRVNSYLKSTPNYTKLDNYSTKGNINPYTGKKGYINPFRYHR